MCDETKQKSKSNEESNQKRLQSLKNHKKAYQNQKSIIQSALSNIDKGSKKIIFDDEVEGVGTKRKHKSNESDMTQILFEEDSDDNFEADFSERKQFEGEEGQKLLQLQSKYKNDKRFKLDERFLNNIPNDNAMENGCDENSEISLKMEKKREWEILEQVLGKSQIKPKYNPDGEKKFMVRFDPSQPQHSKYEVQKDETKLKKSKIKTNKDFEILEEKKTQETAAPEVSKDVFYQVKGNLKESLQENKQVSLLSMFGQVNGNDIEDKDQEEAQEVGITKRNIGHEENPFKYDSSDDEQEENILEGEDQYVKKSSENNKSNSNRTDLWVEPFFFKEDDYRLQEGFDFIEKIKMEDHSQFSKSRRELKEIVKKKIRNVQQKKRPFKHKLGGNKKRKNLKLKKAFKR